MKKSEVLVALCLLTLGTAVLHAATTAAPAVLPEDQVVPTAKHAWDLLKELLTVLGSLAVAGRAYYARVKNGASIIEMFSAIVFGTNSPKAPEVKDTEPKA